MKNKLNSQFVGYSLLVGALLSQVPSMGFDLGIGTDDLYRWERDEQFLNSEMSNREETDLDSKRKTLNETYTALTAADLAQLKTGQIVFKADYVRNENLAEVFVYKIVKGVSPAETTAVLADYNRHKNYFNNGRLKKSEISKVISPLEVEVAYNLSLFLWMSEDYTVWNKMTVTGEGAARTFQVDRRLIKSNRVVAIDGVALIEPFGEADTLVKYYGYIDPGVGVEKAEAIENVKAVVNQLVAQVEKEKATDTDLLKNQVEKLEASISSSQKPEKKLPKKGTETRDY